ncbi:hypothetical protein PIB30_054502 [Stylosanthes scabra]|uniref:Uncharacterized protein n=1 Tax=Stylosanthes scabra TaxID=79078 RepID=A0ABU6SIN8_9FABA|nr:hypothetical protein [Stylosanthes scabra]
MGPEMEIVIVDEVPPKSTIFHRTMIRSHELLHLEAISKLVCAVILEELHHQFSPMMVQPHALTPVANRGDLKVSDTTIPVRVGVKAEASLEFKELEGISIIEEMVTMGGVKDEAKEEWVVSVPFPQVEGNIVKSKVENCHKLIPSLSPLSMRRKVKTL